MLRAIRWVCYALLAVVAALWGLVWLNGGLPGTRDQGVLARLGALVGAVAPAGGLSTGVSIGGPFHLIDQTGRSVTDADFRGKFMLLYFGYSFCPDVCPTELQAIAGALDQLGQDAARVTPVFVTIDPDRDTPAALAEYVKQFDDRIVGLTGTPAQIAEIARAYRVYYAKVTGSAEQSYLMDHSALLYLVGPDGRFVTLLQQGQGPDQLAAALRAQIARRS